MAFVISEQARELNFHSTNSCGSKSKPAVGPNLGPGSYNAGRKGGMTSHSAASSGGAAPFGTSSRRKLNLPYMELLHDMAGNCRIIPDARLSSLAEEASASGTHDSKVTRKRGGQVSMIRHDNRQQTSSLLDIQTKQKHLLI